MPRDSVLVVSCRLRRSKAAEQAVRALSLIPLTLSSLEAVGSVLRRTEIYADAHLRRVAADPFGRIRGVLIDDIAPPTLASFYGWKAAAQKSPSITAALVGDDCLLRKVPVVLCLAASQWGQSVLEQLPSGWPRADTSGNTAEQWRAACNLLLNTTSVGD